MTMSVLAYKLQYMYRYLCPTEGCSRNYPQGGGGPQALFCPVGGGCFVDNVSEGWGGE